MTSIDPSTRPGGQAAPDAESQPGPIPDVRRRRLLFRATHRGTKETDRLIGDYVARHLDMFDTATLDALEEVMELPDVDLADWLTGRRPIPPIAHADLLQVMRQAAIGHAAAARTHGDSA